jgi:hypothetical protein
MQFYRCSNLHQHYTLIGIYLYFTIFIMQVFKFRSRYNPSFKPKKPAVGFLELGLDLDHVCRFNQVHPLLFFRLNFRRYTLKYLCKERKILKIVFCILLFCISCSESNQPKFQQNKKLLKQEMVIRASNGNENIIFSSLTSYCVLPDGRIYCLDGAERKVIVFDERGHYLFNFGRKGKGPGEFQFPKAILATRSKHLYVLDNGHRNISKFSQDGQFIKSVEIQKPIIRFDNFRSGNIVVEIADIDIKNIKNSRIGLCIFNEELKKIKSSFYERPGSNLTWVDANANGQMFTVTIPYYPKIQWEIIGNKLYIGYNSEYKITIFNTIGDSLHQISKDIDREIVGSREKEKWIENVLDEFDNKPNFHPEIIKKSLRKNKLPNYKPVFSKMAQLSEKLLVFLNPKENGIPGFLYDTQDQESQKVLIEYDDFKYFYGKYYRISGDEFNPYNLIRYTLVN